MSADTAPAAMPGERVSLTTEDQKLLERALMKSTEKLYDIAPEKSANDAPCHLSASEASAWAAGFNAAHDALAPILAEKEREIERACSDHANATIGWERERGRAETLEARALAAEAALAAERRDAARYRWLRDGNAYRPEEQMIEGGHALDNLCDAAIRAQGE